MSTQSKTEILSKIKKLQAVAQSTTSPEEAASFAAKVSELLIDHDISQSELDGHEPPEKIGEDELVFSSAAAATWFRKLAKATAILYSCDAYLDYVEDVERRTLTSKGIKFGKNPVYRFVGRKLNREIAASMFQFFYDTAMRVSKNHTHNAAKQNVFRKGFCLMLTFRLMNEALKRYQYHVTNPGNLPMIINRDTRDVALYMNENHAQNVSSRQIDIIDDRSDLIAGWNEGEKIFLGGQVTDQSLNDFQIATQETKRLSKLHGGRVE